MKNNEKNTMGSPEPVDCTTAVQGLKAVKVGELFDLGITRYSECVIINL